MSTRSGGCAVRAGGGAGSGGARRGHKERSKNFTELEKRTVLELIARHRDVLRQGRSNNATNRSKQLVWSTICEEVNKRCGGERPRTPAQVKMWYENYKKKCKMRAHDNQAQAQPSAEGAGLLDGMLWQTIHPLDVKDEEGEADAPLCAHDEDCAPLNMSNGRLSSTNDSDDTMANVLEPHVQIFPHSPPSPLAPSAPSAPASPSPRPHPAPSAPPPGPQPHPPLAPLAPLLTPLAPLITPLQAMEQARIQHTFLQKLNELSNTPLNLSNLDEVKRKSGHERAQEKCEEQSCGGGGGGGVSGGGGGGATDEERQYFSAKRQHAIWEHEAKMKILNMELRQKEEIFSLQKQLFLIELRLKMDFLEKASAK